MKFFLEIDCDNAAFALSDDGYPRLAYETARILRDVARRLEDNRDLIALRVRDTNGNTVGTAKFVDDQNN